MAGTLILSKNNTSKRHGVWNKNHLDSSKAEETHLATNKSCWRPVNLEMASEDKKKMRVEEKLRASTEKVATGATAAIFISCCERDLCRRTNRLSVAYYCNILEEGVIPVAKSLVDQPPFAPRFHY